MRDEVARDLSRSSSAFLRLVWPAVSRFVQAGDLIPCETVTARGLVGAFDQLAGIDAWQLVRGEGFMRGIASRVQFIAPGYEPYNTFTIRYDRENGTKTEFEKRRDALEHQHDGWAVPWLTIQAYVDQDATVLLSACVVKTSDLIRYAMEHEEDDDRATVYRRRTEHEIFLAVAWKNLRRDKIRIKTIGACAAQGEG